MPKTWSDKDDRKQEANQDTAQGRGRSGQRSKDVAARTVSRDRGEEGHTVSRRTHNVGSPNRRLEDRTVAELRNRAKILGIGGRSKMNKDELVRAIRRKNG